MAEFKDSKLWVRLALLLITVGFLLDLFGFATGVGGGGGVGTQACMVIGFLCFLAACFMLLCLVFLDELKDNKAAKIAIIVLCFVAGLATILGIALWGGDGNRKVGKTIVSVNAYASMIGACGCLMAILAGIFVILDLVGVGGGK